MYLDFYTLENDIKKSATNIENNFSCPLPYGDYFEVNDINPALYYNLRKNTDNIYHHIKDMNGIIFMKMKYMLNIFFEKKYDNEILFLKYLGENVTEDIFYFFCDFSTKYSYLNRIIKKISNFTLLNIKDEDKFNFFLKIYNKKNLEDLMIRLKITIKSFDVLQLLENMKKTNNIEKENILRDVNGLKMNTYNNFYEIDSKDEYENNVHVFCFENEKDKENFELFFKINDCLDKEKSSIQFSTKNKKIDQQKEMDIIREINEILSKNGYFSFIDFIKNSVYYKNKTYINKNKFEILNNFYNEDEIINLF